MAVTNSTLSFTTIKSTNIMFTSRISALTGLVVVLLSHGAQGSQGQDDYRQPEACRDCHTSIYEGYVETSHYAAMGAVSPGLLEAQFTPEHERFYVKKDTSNSAYFELVSTADGYAQRILAPGEEGVVELAHLPLDLELGSGKFAKAYVRWEGERLFLNPLSFYTTQQRWAFGPGIYGKLPSMQGMRPVTAACLDCHSGYFEIADRSGYEGPEGPFDNYVHAGDTFVIKKQDMVLPISCAKCHGNGAQHIDYHRKNPEETEAAHITRISDLPRQQQVQVCGFCHTPPGAVKRSPFSFEPGHSYADFIEPAVLDFVNTDPHATQAPYLKVSECFKKTPSMTCTTCHNPHRRERDQLEYFSQRCMECHESGQHCAEISMDDDATSNCIDCHMPVQETQALKEVVGQRGETFPLRMRNHWIKVH